MRSNESSCKLCLLLLVDVVVGTPVPSKRKKQSISFCQILFSSFFLPSLAFSSFSFFLPHDVFLSSLFADSCYVLFLSPSFFTSCQTGVILFRANLLPALLPEWRCVCACTCVSSSFAPLFDLSHMYQLCAAFSFLTPLSQILSRDIDKSLSFFAIFSLHSLVSDFMAFARHTLM